jgi:hypothetical protein
MPEKNSDKSPKQEKPEKPEEVKAPPPIMTTEGEEQQVKQ